MRVRGLAGEMALYPKITLRPVTKVTEPEGSSATMQEDKPAKPEKSDNDGAEIIGRQVDQT